MKEETLSTGGSGHKNLEFPEEPPLPRPHRRVLQRNLTSSAVFERIKKAERLKEVGERELGFYLLEIKRRKLYTRFGCSSFSQFVKLKTGQKQKKARELVRVARALEGLPLLDEAFSRGDVYWGAVRAVRCLPPSLPPRGR